MECVENGSGTKHQSTSNPREAFQCQSPQSKSFSVCSPHPKRVFLAGAGAAATRRPGRVLKAEAAPLSAEARSKIKERVVLQIKAAEAGSSGG